MDSSQSGSKDDGRPTPKREPSEAPHPRRPVRLPYKPDQVTKGAKPPPEKRER